jgi:ParB family chromosome partitioning protein
MATDTIVRVDPKTLLVGANVRRTTKITQEFVASVKDLGVRIPITAYETPEGLVVVDGQRRTLAAVDADLAEVPVYVTEAPDEAGRVVDQVVVNEHREGLETGEQIAAVQQLALFDLAVPAIAKKLGLRKGFVDDAVKVGASPAALEYYQSGKSYSAAVRIAEFEGLPEQSQLLGLNQEWQVREKADDLNKKRERVIVTEQIKAMEGVTFIAEPGDGSATFQPITRLFLDKQCTEAVDELPHERLVELAGDGLVAWPSWGYVDGRHRMSIAYGVTGWKGRGLHAPSWAVSREPKPTTPEDVEAAKAERRLARETTKEWVAAGVLRLEFLQGLVQRKTPPKGWEAAVARRMLNNAGGFSTTQLKSMLAILQLGEEAGIGSFRQSIEADLAKRPTMAPQIMLAVELGCVEGGGDFERKGWNPQAWQASVATTAAYLQLLESWGHVLSDVEKSVITAAAKKKPAAKK